MMKIFVIIAMVSLVQACAPTIEKMQSAKSAKEYAKVIGMSPSKGTKSGDDLYFNFTRQISVLHKENAATVTQDEISKIDSKMSKYCELRGGKFDSHQSGGSLAASYASALREWQSGSDGFVKASFESSGMAGLLIGSRAEFMAVQNLRSSFSCRDYNGIIFEGEKYDKIESYKPMRLNEKAVYEIGFIVRVPNYFLLQN
jgi:hypothetical protein